MKTEWKNGALVAYVTGEIDHHAAQDVRCEVEAELSRTGCKCLILDFSGVSFMDSAGIGLILGRYRRMQECGGRLRVVGASPRIERMMRMAGLSRLDVLETEQKEEKGGNRRGTEKE